MRSGDVPLVNYYKARDCLAMLKEMKTHENLFYTNQSQSSPILPPMLNSPPFMIGGKKTQSVVPSSNIASLLSPEICSPLILMSLHGKFGIN